MREVIKSLSPLMSGINNAYGGESDDANDAIDAQDLTGFQKRMESVDKEVTFFARYYPIRV